MDRFATRAAALALALTGVLHAQDANDRPPTAFRGARILTSNGPAVDNGILIIAGGKVQAVGGADLAIPDGARIVDVTGRTITPGLVDAGATVGVRTRDANEQEREVTPQMRIVDAVDPADRGFARVRKAGVTTVMLTPGDRSVVGGLGAILKTRGDTVQQMLVKDEAGLKIVLGPEPSAGNRPIRGGVPTGLAYRRPTTRMGVIWSIREAFYKAQEYRRRSIGEGEGSDADPGLEVLVRALDRKLAVHTTARAEQDIRTALRLAEEFGYETVINEAVESHRVIQMLADAKVKVLLSGASALTGRGDEGAFGEYRWSTATALAKAGVPFAIHTGDQFGSMQLIHEATFAVRYGLDPDLALRAVTSIPAEILGVADRIGSLQAGRDADFVIWSGDPFAPTSRAEAVYIEGLEVGG